MLDFAIYIELIFVNAFPLVESTTCHNTALSKRILILTRRKFSSLLITRLLIIVRISICVPASGKNIKFYG